MQLTTEQELMASAIRNHINGKTGKQVLVCHGVAGTGKTRVLTAIANEFPHAKLCAFTGKAASVLRAKLSRTSQGVVSRRPCDGDTSVTRSGLKACTVHSLFYKLVDKGVDEKTGKRILIFSRIYAEGAMRGRIILLDECSMIDRKTANNLLLSGALIIAVGDPGQLPPVHGAAFFNQADVSLTTIHRQALDSAVIRQAHNMRENGRYVADGPDFQIAGRVSDEQMLMADTILCHRNATRRKINKQVRSLLGYNLPYPMAGEQVLCLKNSHEHGIFNGVTYELAHHFQPDDAAISLLIDGQEVEVPECVFVNGGTIDDYDDDEFVSAFDYGWCLTVHKAQGSEWNRVLLIDENKKYDRRKWAYTGITRAAKSIIVQG